MVKISRVMVAVFLAVLLFVLLPIGVFANNQETSFYVMDKSGVLSESDKEEINQVSNVLFEQTGCKLSVAVVDFLGGKSIEQYSSELYEQNSMGSNGLLIVFSIAEENYHILQGTDIEAQLSDAQLNDMLQTVVEQDFSDGEYRKAAMECYRFFAEQLGEIYSAITDPQLYQDWLEEQRLLEEQRIAERARWFSVFVISVTIASVFTSFMIFFSLIKTKNRRRKAT